MTDKILPEWYSIIYNVLREYECFDMNMFEENGGYQVYNELKNLLKKEEVNKP